MRKVIHLSLILTFLLGFFAQTSFANTTSPLRVLTDSMPKITVPEVTVCPGENFEIGLTADFFEDIQSFQFTLNWDPTVLMSDTIVSFLATEFSSNVQINLRPMDGVLEMTWFGNPTTVMDGSNILKLKFDAVGGNGMSTNFEFMSDPTPLEFIKKIANVATQVDGKVVENATFIRQPEIVSVMVTDVTSAGNDGAIDITVNSGTAPYTFGWTNGATTEDIMGLSPGTYGCLITDSLGCQFSSPIYEVSLINADNKIEDLEFLTVTPNPASEVVEINGRLSQPTLMTFEVFTAVGQLLYNEQFVSSSINHRIDLDTYSAGVYFIKLQTQQGQAIRKFIRK